MVLARGSKPSSVGVFYGMSCSMYLCVKMRPVQVLCVVSAFELTGGHEMRFLGFDGRKGLGAFGNCRA